MGEVDEVRRPREAEGTAHSGRRMVALFVAGALAVVGYFALGMPGMDHGSGTVQHEDELHP